MAKLKDIKGTGIQFLDADPVVNVGAWSSGADLNTARKASMGFGVLTANIMAGGNNPGGGTTWDVVEQYNGTAWTEITDLNTARRSGGGVGSTCRSKYVVTGVHEVHGHRHGGCIGAVAPAAAIDQRQTVHSRICDTWC